jgi:hypothetical protein
MVRGLGANYMRGLRDIHLKMSSFQWACPKPRLSVT